MQGEIVLREDTKYAYATGRIRALEKQLLTKRDISRFIDASTPQGAGSILSEKGYPEELSTISKWSDIEAILRGEQKRVLNLLSELSLDNLASDLFLKRYDFYNLKVLFKSKYSGVNLDHLLLDMGTLRVDLLRELIEGNASGIPNFISQAAQKANQIWEEKGNPQLVEITIDKEMYSHIGFVLGKFNNPFLEGWLRLQIDLYNIKTLLRLKWVGAQSETFEKGIVEGGNIDKGELLSLRKEDWQTTTEYFRKGRYADLVNKSIEELTQSGSLSQVERLSVDLNISYLRKSKFQAFGIEPLISYVLLKEYELGALRTISVAKANGVSEDLIRERLSNEYL